MNHLVAAWQAEKGCLPHRARHMGGPQGIGSGGCAEATVCLGAGAYALLCTIPTSDHTTYVVLGMRKALTVIEREGRMPSIAANYHLLLLDDEGTVHEPIKSRLHTFDVENRGAQVHQVSLVRLNSGVPDDRVAPALMPTSSRRSWPLAGGMSGRSSAEKECLLPDFLLDGIRRSASSNPNTHRSHASNGVVLTFEGP